MVYFLFMGQNYSVIMVIETKAHIVELKFVIKMTKILFAHPSDHLLKRGPCATKPDTKQFTFSLAY